MNTAQTNVSAGQNTVDQRPRDSSVSGGHKPRQKDQGGTTLSAGYARVSLADGTQDAERQIEELRETGCERIWNDQISGLRAQKPQLADALGHLRPGDSLTVTELSRLGRDVRGVLELIDSLEQSGVSLRVLNLGLDTSTPSGRLLVTVLAAVARLEVDLLRERTRSGLAHARKNGKTLGRPRVLTPAQITEAKRMSEHLSPREIGGVLGCSERTIRRVINGEGEMG